MLKIPKPVFFISGALIGSAAVWYFIPDSRSSSAPKKIKKPVVTEFAEDVKEDQSLQQLNSILKRNEGENQVYTPSEVSVETFENIDRDSRLYDSLKKAHAGIVVVENDTEEQDHSQDVVVNPEFLKKDKLLGRETVKIIQVDDEQVSSDSVSAKMTGITPRSTTILETEHWVSPVNYKGYKLGRTRLVLFGTTPGNIALLRFETELYLVFAGKVYALLPSAGFASLKPLQDKKLSASLLSNVH